MSRYTIEAIIHLAEARKTVDPPANTAYLLAEFAGRPSWSHANRLARFKSDLEETVSRSLPIIGGGYGCIRIIFGLFDLSTVEQTELKTLVASHRADLEQKYELRRIHVQLL